MTDQIADLLVRIKNASMVNKFEVAISHSKMKEAILAILKSEGFVKSFDITEDGPKKIIKISLSSTKRFSHLKQISKPGQRIYAKSKNIPHPIRGLGLVIVSTPKGIVRAKDAAKQGMGGELICEIW